MFKQSSSPSTGSDAETVIGPSVKVEGDVVAVGDVIVEGAVHGTISTDKSLTVGTNAEIKADIKAESATIGGSVTGKISVSSSLSLRSTAKVNGDINTATLSIENGAQVNGQISMGSAPVSSVKQGDKHSSGQE